MTKSKEAFSLLSARVRFAPILFFYLSLFIWLTCLLVLLFLGYIDARMSDGGGGHIWNGCAPPPYHSRTGVYMMDCEHKQHPNETENRVNGQMSIFSRAAVFYWFKLKLYVNGHTITWIWRGRIWLVQIDCRWASFRYSSNVNEH